MPQGGAGGKTKKAAKGKGGPAAPTAKQQRTAINKAKGVAGRLK